jgi:hypothetical protein
VEAGRGPTNGNAITSLVLGICGLVVFPPIGILAVIFGNRARREIAQRGEDGAGLATAGVILGWIGTALTALFVLFVIVFIVAVVAVGTSV